MKKIITNSFLIYLIFLLGNNANASNNTIAFIEGTSNCKTYNFRDSSGNLSYTPTSFYWNFGDGTTATTQYATHSYAANGSYTVTHVVNNGTKRDTAVLNLEVSCRELKPLKADFNFFIDDSVSASNVFFTENCNGAPISYLWVFGDNAGSTSASPSHIYPNSQFTQNYTVTLIVSDGTTSDTIQKVVTIYKYDPCKYRKAYFQWTKDDSSCTQLIFSNLSHYTFTNYQWSFGNTGTSISKSPSYQFASEGYYIVKLIASSSVCSDTIIQKVRVTCRNCNSVEADIDLVVDSTNKSKAQLYNYSRGAIGGHYWNFGDGTTSKANAPAHTYTSPGNIVLTYIVSDTGTCKDTAYIKFTIDSLGNIKRGNLSFSLQVIDKTNNATSIIKTEKINTKLMVYPNPASNLLYIKNTTSQIQTIYIFDIRGAEVFNMKIEGLEQSSVDIQNWKRGLYIMVSNTGERLKLMVE